VLRLPRDRFLVLVHRDPTVGLANSAALIRRLRLAEAARLGTTPTGGLRATPAGGFDRVRTVATPLAVIHGTAEPRRAAAVMGSRGADWADMHRSGRLCQSEIWVGRVVGDAVGAQMEVAGGIDVCESGR
jgi:hypothetical protein